ncbi:MAG: hypothetical protein ACRCZE_00605 [Candidatus Altimarinota bacterium]
MRKIQLQSSSDLKNFLRLLDLPGIHQDLSELLDVLMNIEYKEQDHLEKGNYEKAAESRQKELQIMEEIIEKLNQKQILIDGVLEADVSVKNSSNKLS